MNIQPAFSEVLAGNQLSPFTICVIVMIFFLFVVLGIAGFVKAIAEKIGGGEEK